jgi:8-oxo-dGTP pyrophosphatase MutT (NUDIX family)
MRCDAALRRLIADRLAAWDVRAEGEGDQRRAAVAVVIAEAGHGAGVPGLPQHPQWSDDAALVLTRRSGDLRAHAGQWALPGGRIDPGETAEDAALRELGEEVGLALGPECLLGRLDDYPTRSGYCITPVVFWGGAVREMAPNPAEVRSIHRIEVREFLRADAPLLETIPETPRPVLRMPVGDNWIAAPTAAVLYQFREVCILGRPTRVVHFDQPLFAWR